MWERKIDPVGCWRLEQVTQRGCGISSFGDTQNSTKRDSALGRELDQVTSGIPFQPKLVRILCYFLAGPYLSHNLSYLILEFVIVKCKRKALLSDCNWF